MRSVRIRTSFRDSLLEFLSFSGRRNRRTCIQNEAHSERGWEPCLQSSLTCCKLPKLTSCCRIDLAARAWDCKNRILCIQSAGIANRSEPRQPMARKTQDYSRNRTRGRKVKRRHVFGMLALLSFLLVVFFLPRVLTSRTVLLGLIDRYAGLAPLKVDLEGVQAGWFRPVAADGIRLLDENRNTIATVGKIETEKGLIGWITNSSNLGLIKISNVEAAVVAYDGTTNIEQAIAPLLSQIESDPTEETAPASASRGTVEIQNSRILLAESNRPEQWVVNIPRATLTLPDAEQVIGPIELEVSISDASETVANSHGVLKAKVNQSGADQALELQAQIDDVPLDFWHVVHARLPDVPVDALRGRVSARISGTIEGDSAWSLNVQQLQAAGLSLVAPQLVGEQPANLQLIQGSGRCTLADSTLRLEDTRLACDFANAVASASIPWPIEIPSADDPFLDGAVIEANGSVDLPKLAVAAQALIPLREDTQLLSGTAAFDVGQQLDLEQRPSSHIKLELAGLKATSGGQPLSWDEPLTIELAANRANGKLAFGAVAEAQFASVQGGGTIESGQINGSIDLDLLHRKLSQWVELPIQQMHGSANLGIHWKLESQDVVTASGSLNSTPIQIATSTGGRLQEPAWTGDFSAQFKLADGAPQSIEIARCELKAKDEKLVVALDQAFYLVDTAGIAAEPAAFNVDLHVDLDKCKHRASVWLSEPPDFEMKGNLQLAASGLIDRNHVELLNANWSSRPLAIRTPQLSFFEPQMVGKFNGRIDTNDFTRLVVDVLQVQSTSFSLGAKDAANPDGSASRIGQAMVRIDLDRIMRSVGTGTAGASGTVESRSELPLAAVRPADSGSNQVSATGMVQGQLAWQVSSQAAGINSQFTGENIMILSQAADQIAPQPIWNEPNMTANLAGTWIVETGAVDVQTLQLTTPWLSYEGKVNYDATDTNQNVQIHGQAVYDSAQLSSRLQPFTGGQVKLSGQQNVPVELTWTQSSDETVPMLAGLNASTRLGWEQAIVAGITVGKADVPVTIKSGHLATAAEVPVSGGALRWDLDSDLTASQLVIVQKPMTVLDNVQITEEMCQGWLKFVTPLLAEATSVDGRLSLRLDQALLTPSQPKQQTVVGQIVIHNATVGPGPLSNQVISLARQLESIRKRDFTQAVSNTQRVWMDMPEQRIDFQMLDGKVIHRNLNVTVGDATISTAGAVSVDGQLEMLATMPIPDDWAEKSPWLAGFKGQSLQFPVGGTLSNPRIDSRLLQDLGRQTLQNAASGLLQQGLNRGLDKLLGGQTDGGSSPGSNAGNGDPIRGLGDRLLNGQGLNLPNLFPGLGAPAQPSPVLPPRGNP